VEQELKSLIATVLEIQDEDVTDNLSIDNGDWDSLRHMEIVAVIEDAFNIMFSADEIVSITSFVKIKEVVASKLDTQ